MRGGGAWFEKTLQNRPLRPVFITAPRMTDCSIHPRSLRRQLAPLILLAAASRCLAASPEGDAKAVEFFENKIRPVLVEKCYDCHSVKEGKSKGGLLLDTRESARQGGDSGPAVVPGDQVASLLHKAISYADQKLQMPPKEQLPAEVVADFATWIAAGATDPRDGKPVVVSTIDIEEGRKHWSFQPITNPPVPEVKDKQWPRTDDRSLHSRGLGGEGAQARGRCAAGGIAAAHIFRSHRPAACVR